MAKSNAPQSENSAFLGLGALAALGLAGLGAYVTRRRRTVLIGDEPIPAESSVEPIVPPAADDRPYVTYPEAEAGPAAVEETQLLLAPSGSALPDGPLPTGEARQQLLDRMVAAAPDAANPFTSVKGRRRRARLILQAREHQQAESASGFDWRRYQTSLDRSDRETAAAEREAVDA